MADVVFRLDKIGDFIYLLNKYGRDEKNILQRRFKKDTQSLEMLFDLLSTFDELGFDDAMSFGRTTRRIQTVSNNKHLSMIEIRVKSTLWRVITYADYDKKALVMLDAFQHHKSKTMSAIVNENEHSARIAAKLLEEVD